MRRAGTVVGLMMTLGAMAGLPLALGSLPPDGELRADLPTAQEYAVLPRPDAPRPFVSVGPASVRDRVEVDAAQTLLPGLQLETWRVNYGDRWLREVTRPLLVGPFAAEGTDVCGFAIRLGAGLFDTTRAGAGLQTVLRNRLAKLFPWSVSGITFPKLRDVTLHLQFGESAVHVALRLVLVDGTVLSVSAPVRIAERAGTPAIELAGPVATDWSGPTWEEARSKASSLATAGVGVLGGVLGCIVAFPVGCAIGAAAGAGVGSGIDVDDTVRGFAHEEITNRLNIALAELAIGMRQLRQPWRPFTTREDEIRFRLASAPRITVDGMVISLCARVFTREPKINAGIKGPPQAVSAPPSVRDVDSGATVQVAGNADALNMLLYFLWQSQFLRRLGTETSLLNALPAEVRNLAFDVTGFDPGLPPTVATSIENARSDQLAFVLGDVRLGTWGARQVVAHAVASVSAGESDGKLQLGVAVQQITANCTEHVDGHARLTPCLSDLLPVARERLDQPLTFALDGGDLLSQLPQLAFEGVRLHLSHLTASTTGSPPGLELRVDAALEAERR